MAISYQPLKDLEGAKGITIRSLYTKDVITHSAYKSILNGDPVSLAQIDSICQHLKLPIEQVVTITLEEDA